MVGAGKAEGAMDAGNMLKPALARGELHCIGATTLDEYRKYVEKDAALERRFQKVLVGEPTVEDTIAILRGLKEKYEVHHGVEITDPAIVAAAELSNRYITDRFLPDKAIDLDRRGGGASRSRSIPSRRRWTSSTAADPAQDRARGGEEGEGRGVEEAPDLIEDEIDKLEREVRRPRGDLDRREGDVAGAAHLKEEIDRLRSQIEAVHAQGRLQQGRRAAVRAAARAGESWKDAQASEASKAGRARRAPQLLRTMVGAEEIAEVVSRATGIPVSKMMQGERDKLLQMEQAARARRRPGRGDHRGPTRSAARAPGLSGSGTGRPARSCSSARPAWARPSCARRSPVPVRRATSAMIRIDMSEFMEKHSVARLIGAPPGYVGYDEGGYLTEAVRRKPTACSCSTRSRRAPGRVQRAAAGARRRRLTDGQGRTVDFKNTVIVMTEQPRLAPDHADGRQPGEEIGDAVWVEVKQHFRPSAHPDQGARIAAGKMDIKLDIVADERWPSWPRSASTPRSVRARSSARSSSASRTRSPKLILDSRYGPRT